MAGKRGEIGYLAPHTSDVTETHGAYPRACWLISDMAIYFFHGWAYLCG
jgi:hypothetical protein